MLDVREMLRRLRLGESARAVARGLGVSRNTIREYMVWFEAEALLAGDATALPSSAELEERLARAEPVAEPPRLIPYRGEIVRRPPRDPPLAHVRDGVGRVTAEPPRGVECA